MDVGNLLRPGRTCLNDLSNSIPCDRVKLVKEKIKMINKIWFDFECPQCHHDVSVEVKKSSIHDGDSVVCECPECSKESHIIIGFEID